MYDHPTPEVVDFTNLPKVYISVYAYGEDRYDLTFNPCSANFPTLCPMNASVPIEGGATIPVSVSDVATIIPIALAIPDFEGSATLRIFSNSTETQIGCFQAVMMNGHSFSHPAAIGSTLGVFTFIALLASFATAIYGISVPQMRTHYAHSLSMLVVFEVFQSIFFSGALSLNYPSALSAWWSNFAWSAGQIYTHSIVNSVNKFTGTSGNSSQVGGAGSTSINNNGGLQQQIYGRSLQSSEEIASNIANKIYNRATTTANSTTVDPRMYSWAGLPVQPGMPLPGNWSNFSGTLQDIGIPVADAFLVGFLWFLILMACIIGAIIIFKYSLELFSRIKWIKQDRFALFRSRWAGFLGLVILRAMLIGFFMMMTLALYQFSYGGKAGPLAIAVIVFLIFFAGALGAAFYACFYRTKFGKYQSSPDRVHFQRRKLMNIIPWYKTLRESSMEQNANKSKFSGSIPLFRLHYVTEDSEKQSVHNDTAYTKRFGWLSARYRRSRWWFFAFWIVYQFVRACFIGGAQSNPTAQVIGLFVWEFIAFIAIVIINPFESARNTALAVYMLGFSKVSTAGLSIGFLTQLNLARIPTTVIGIVIIVIQGFLVIGMLILIVLSAISSYMSLTRNREEFKPHGLENIRMKYFGNIEHKATDLPPPPTPEPEEPKFGFEVKTVRRAPKIEDEDIDFFPDMSPHPGAQSTYSLAGRASRSNSMQNQLPPHPGAHSTYSLAGRASRSNSMQNQLPPHPGALAQNSIQGRASRSNSMRSHYSGSGVPFGARVHRASWSSRDFQDFYEEEDDQETPYGVPLRSLSRASRHKPSEDSTVSMQPLVRPSASHSALRASTPTQELRQKYSSQRVNAIGQAS